MENRRLAPELVLLGLSPDGRVAGHSPGFDFALAGAVLLDLVLAERIDVLDKRVMVLDATPLGDPVLDEAVAAIATGRPRRAKDWIRRLSRGLRKRVLARLVRDGLVHMQPVHLLRIFPAVRYPVTDPAVVTRLRQELDTAVRGGATVEPHAAALCSLLTPAGLDRRLFPDIPRRQLRARLVEISGGNWASAAVTAAVRDVQAAMIAVAAAAAAGAGSG